MSYPDCRPRCNRPRLGRQHGVILVVVAMHAVAADGIEIGEPVEIRADVPNPVVAAESRPGKPWAPARPCHPARRSRCIRPIFSSSAAGEIDEAPSRMPTARRPRRRSIPGPARWWPDPPPGRAPIVEDLQPPELDVRLLYVDPIVRRHAVAAPAPRSGSHAPPAIPRS
jgi:hypothetical protein